MRKVTAMFVAAIALWGTDVAPGRAVPTRVSANSDVSAPDPEWRDGPARCIRVLVADCSCKPELETDVDCTDAGFEPCFIAQVTDGVPNAPECLAPPWGCETPLDCDSTEGQVSISLSSGADCTYMCDSFKFAKNGVYQGSLSGSSSSAFVIKIGGDPIPCKAALDECESDTDADSVSVECWPGPAATCTLTIKDCCRRCPGPG